MFKLVKEPVAPWPARWNGVSPTGEVVEQSLTLEMVRIGHEEFNRLFPTDGSVPPLNDRAMFDRLVRGWSGVVDADDRALAFSDANITALLDVAGFAAAFGRAYITYWAAIREEREKNSAPSPAGKQAAEPPTGDVATGGAR